MITSLLLLAVTATTPAAQATTIAPAAIAAPLDYDAAKALADRDEAAMSKLSADMLRRSQSGVLERAAASCQTTEAPKSFTVVLELDAKGRVTNHWRNAETGLAKCMDDKLARQMFYVPSKAPFYISFEVSFTP
ncbi:hypothetical protein LF41_1421 [Lysobacter dokdonensis DS-58]|uniref:AgmX/PglI C-terminal domain-containing protein n=1 Tax=Lysobacter dokdonensis DS-58 TaxID=1300345 RepID=A0A0A2WH83_9GAMM|nr:hypothetical protein [Lysobacter dokdonensis]KGQ18067.1 hypothetical protein LF41_1421 [Lysobacter dokdonensis DS-58]